MFLCSSQVQLVRGCAQTTSLRSEIVRKTEKRLNYKCRNYKLRNDKHHKSINSERQMSEVTNDESDKHRK